MQFFTNSTIENSITKLFQNDPHPPISTVLKDSDFSTSLRIEIPCLINYLANDDILATLTAWALTPEGPNDEDCDRLVRSAVSVLSSPSKSLQEKLQDNEIFLQALKQCIENNIYNNLKLCGHFQRIMESMIKYTNDGFLQHFPNLCTFLLRNINMLSLKELLLRILTDYQEAFTDEEYDNMILQIAQESNKENGYFVVILMRDILNEKRNATIASFQNDSVLRLLLESATSPSKNNSMPLFECTIFQLIEKISFGFPCATAVIAEFRKQYQFDINKITCGSIAAFSIFKDGLDTFLPRFFQKPSITKLNELILARLKEMNEVQLGGIIDRFEITKKIINTFDSHIVNGHLTNLAMFLNSKPHISQTLQTKQWKQFVNDKLLPRNEMKQLQRIEEDKPNELLSPKKQNLAPIGSFSGKGGIKALVQFAQAQIDSQRAIEAQQNQTSSSDMSLNSLLGNDESGAKKSTEKSPAFTLGLQAGFSFSIPTLYQAEDNDEPMIC